MVPLHRRITFAAAALLGRGGGGCAAFRAFVHTTKNVRHITIIPSPRTHIIMSLNYESYTTNNSPRSCRLSSSLIMMLSTVVDQSGDTLEVSTATYDSSDDEDEDDEDEDDEYDDGQASDDIIEDTTDDDSPSSLLLKALTKSVQSALNNLSKKTSSLQREMDKAQALEDTMNRANLIVSNLYRLPPGTEKAEVENWENGGEIVELVLNTKEYVSAQEESDALFAAARKMKRGSKIVGELLLQSIAGEELLKDAMLDLEGVTTNSQGVDEGTLVLIQERLERKSKQTSFKMLEVSNDASKQSQSNNRSNKRSRDKENNKPNPRELTSPSGHKVLVGRNRRDNEALCFKLCKPTDIWMHSRGCPGAHVLLCFRRGSPEIKDEDLQFAADLAAFYSDARTERRAPITTAEPRHISKPRGAPLGAVSLRQEGKTLVGRPDNVSDELKEAREKSGAAWDEKGYRKLGTRSKNKKKTAAVEKARKEKSREDAKNKNKRRKKKEEKDWY